MATIKDVAALAGISYTTVSHVVNKTRPVSDEVRLKVEAAIQRLDYVPSAVARSLKAKTTATIGLLVPNSLNPYFAELARGIEDYCERNGYCVILCNSDDNPQKQRSYLRMLQEKRIDGLIVTSVGSDARLAEGLAGVRTPMVIVDRALDGLEADLVRIDHEHGAYLATRHLLELGHRDIACIGGPAHTSVAQMRMAGFWRALKEVGVQVPIERVLESDFTSTGGYEAAASLLEQAPPSAIFAGNDMMGIGVLRAAAERSIRVPTELSVIGFDDIQMSRYVYPALTTVGQSILQLGEMAAEVLLRRIATPERPTDQRIVTPSIVLRESTAPLACMFDQYP
ncbi:transcriptional regulator, LacI family [Pseudomonas sp. ok272]|uniref:LacI family DNA-binding transcriptional regulator n=1 Tax=unclassified Pseudomonas TaxID=196821 RepID=UPI0008AD8022|nr:MULTISPECIES: LacI family DNA-binding transcriptional regulator [unclassified Pseudomonas]SEM51662.1 transcriptional regulator, LacI family [Pseudomonas sp. ok272]SFM23463.1 transcriptional regulator, LacI family [Pseudomonas sp. ok602]